MSALHRLRRLMIVADAGKAQENAIWVKHRGWTYRHLLTMPFFYRVEDRAVAEKDIEIARLTEKPDDIKIETIQIKEVELTW